MRKLICILLLCCFLLCSCGTDGGDASSNLSSKGNSSTSSKVQSEVQSEAQSKEPVVPAVNDYSERTYMIIDILDYLKLDGRYKEKKDDLNKYTGITYDNAYNCISFVADCEGDVTLSLDVKLFNADKEGWRDRYFTVYIDGVRQEERLAVEGGLMVYTNCSLTVAKGLSKGKHTIEIYRQNEANHAAMLLKSITMKGVPCEKPADRDLLIEFVGDSITAGYGNLGMSGIENPSHAKNSDATSTYAFLTAKNLNADITATCRSGHMFSGEKPPFSDFYNQINWIRDNTPYTPTRHPDIVVINLGTNDASHADHATLADYTVKALETVKKVHPDAKIVWAYGLMGSNVEGQIMKGIQTYGGEAKGVYYCPLQTDWSGGGGHPSLAGHKAAADTLTKFIQDKGLV
ncbi:MAG: hypothetical protein IJF58_06285 [Clostridia bacterium]|nr:hypothetical protein [Clostridia bacterium]